MNYIIKLNTAAGDIYLGPYLSLYSAREVAQGRGQIIEVIKPADLDAAQIQEMTQKELLKLLECDTL
jgi:hypothetical protein